MIKIDKKIVGYAVNKPAASQAEPKKEFPREGGGDLGDDEEEVGPLRGREQRPETRNQNGNQSTESTIFWF